MSLGTRHALFGLYSLGLLASSLPVLAALLGFSRSDSSASHLVLIPFITLALIYQGRREIFSSVRFAGLPGGALILAGLAGLVVGVVIASGAAGGSLSLRVATIATLWAGGFLMFYGGSAFRAARFPLLFLLFMVPIPSVILDGIVSVLKAGSAAGVAGMFTLTGMPYHREATFIFALPNLTIEVADQCSGIRSSIALCLTALMLGRMSLQQTWTKVLLVVAVFPLTVLKNAIRIVTLSWLAVKVDPAFLAGRLHTDGGVVFFVLALVLMAPILIMLRRLERPFDVAPATVPVDGARIEPESSGLRPTARVSEGSR